MSSTTQLGLPLLQAAQAQKHVTVNEALSRIDGLTQLTIQSLTAAVPPAVVVDGAVHGVPPGAVNAWSGEDGKLAVGRNGGWDFVTPRRGWRGFVVDEGAVATHDGAGWRVGQVTLSPAGAGLSLTVQEHDHVIQAGTVSTTPALIPANALVFGVTARVIAAIAGSLTGWELGNPGAAGRYGSGLGLGVGSFARGVLGQPTAFYTPTALQLDATGGSFSGGTVRVAVHYLELSLPQL